MILCTIPQFSCLIDPTNKAILTTYQLNDNETAFVQLIDLFHHRQDDHNLPMIVSEYEELFEKINTTRLVVLKVLKYQPTVQPLQIEKSRLQPAIRPIQTSQKNPQNNQDIDPVLQFLSGNVD